MLDTKRFGMLAALLFLVVGIVGIVSLFGTNDVGVTGATIAEISTADTCYDLDGFNEYIASEAYLEYSNGVKEVYQDSCESQAILVEYVCEDGLVEGKRVECENLCEMGACN